MTKETPARKKGRTTGTKGITPEEIEKFLEGCDFPCGQERLIGYLEQQEAPEHVVREVQGIPDREYHGAHEVVDAVSSQATSPRGASGAWVVGGRE